MISGLEAQRTPLREHRTYRVVPPAVTIERWESHLPRLGVTRVADVTGMDCIGIDTVMVARPNARSLSVSQGKGIDLGCAKASGIMEAVEQYHAEHVERPLRLATRTELSRSQSVVDCGRLPQFVKTFTPSVRTLWIEGLSLVSGSPFWVPYELVNLDFTLPLPEGSGYFQSGSNGLASGNHPLEAVTHGLYEVVERDALTLFYHLPPELQRARRIDLSSVRCGPCVALLAKYERADIDVAVWDVTSDVGIPCFLCLILERPDCFRLVGEARGSGCHSDPNIALSRALCEAAQSRLTRIVGSRDDLQSEHVDVLRSERGAAVTRSLMADSAGPRVAFEPSRSHASATLEEDQAWILERLDHVGLTEAIVVDLSRGELPGFVVKVLVPGLEAVCGAQGFRSGERLKAQLAKLERAC